MQSITLLLVALAAVLQCCDMEYIPPGPAYPCPKETDSHLLFPCVCEKGTDTGLHILCENTGLAAISVGIGNVAGLGLPIEKLTLRECKISRLFGSLLHRSTLRTLHIEATPLVSIEPYTFAGANRTLQELHLRGTHLQEFPSEAFKILGNLTILRIDGHEITSLPKDIFAGSEASGRLERLYIVNGLISDVSPDAFQTLKKLKTLDLHGNRLATLKRNQFKGLREAEVLDLSHNNITKLDGTHIGDLTKLGWCNVSHNNIGDIPRGMFARNTVLKVLHLDNNNIKKLDTNSFRGMRFLRRLFLQDNQIADVGRGTFAAVTRIGTVDLARNLITKVDYQMFQQVRYAEVINLAENRIESIDTQAFTDLYLATVNISHNALSRIEPNAFINCNNMTVLDLSHNQLTNFSKGAFDGNSYAALLQVSYNNFTDLGQIPIQNMTGIQILNASHNQIEVIPKNTFPKLYELHTVDVSYNHLREISNSIFQNLFSLRYLNLSHNSMEQVKPSTFGTLPTVLELKLSHNRLRDISRGGLAKLASCRELDVSHNQLDRVFQIPISLGGLDFSHNNLTELKANTWPVMNALLRLNLANNQIQDRLEGHSFSGLLALQRLNLASNGITRPPWEALNTMSSLQYLYLQNNNLTALARSAFGNLPTLFQLDLSGNQLADIGQRTFLGLQQLIDLSLRGNRLRHVPNEAFKSLVALQKLDLSHNMLEKINNKTHGLLDDCLSIEMVNLSHNNFGFLTKKMFPSNPYIPYKLYEVDLSYNKMPVVTFDITHGTSKLKKLNLSYNVINDVRSNVIGNLTSLEVLDLSGNEIEDLVSRSSQDPALEFPVNLSELYLRENRLRTLPADRISGAKRLRVLDVRDNRLSVFEPQFVRKIEADGMQVLFEGNSLKCDCLTRPLKHFTNHLPLSRHGVNLHYLNLPCAEPAGLENHTISSLDEERLICAGNTTELEAGLNRTGNTVKGSFDFVTEPDLALRDIQYSQVSIYAHWYVLTTADVADFFVFVRDDKNNIIYSQDIAYNLRSVIVAFDDKFTMAVKNGGKLELCLQARSSLDSVRRWFPNQCKVLETDFESWPKKLSVDKRRLTKKKVIYSWFGTSSVLGLVSDSILITLCIFLGVCFRRMADFEI